MIKSKKIKKKKSKQRKNGKTFKYASKLIMGTCPLKRIKKANIIPKFNNKISPAI